MNNSEWSDYDNRDIDIPALVDTQRARRDALIQFRGILPMILPGDHPEDDWVWLPGEG